MMLLGNSPGPYRSHGLPEPLGWMCTLVRRHVRNLDVVRCQRRQIRYRCCTQSCRDDGLVHFVLQTSNSLIVLFGDSGHGFKMMRVFGQWVKNLLDSERQDEARWKWRQDTEKKDWGDEVSWKVGSSRQVRGLLSEKRQLEQARL